MPKTVVCLGHQPLWQDSGDLAQFVVGGSIDVRVLRGWHT